MIGYVMTGWQDRIVQFPSRYTKTNETVSSVTLTADPGTVTQPGTAVSAANLMNMETGIAEAHNELDNIFAISCMGGF